MKESPGDAERLAEATARRLLERATALDADGPTLAQLRQAAAEAGISHTAFDAAVAEWRADRPSAAPMLTPRGWAGALLRNIAGMASGYAAVAVLVFAQRLVAAPWLVHKLTDPIGLAIGAVVSARLRARTATVVLGGLAVSQGAEFLMDLFAGAPAIHGFSAHIALMIAGVAGVAVGRSIWGRSNGPRARSHADNAGIAADRPSEETSTSAFGFARLNRKRAFAVVAFWSLLALQPKRADAQQHWLAFDVDAVAGGGPRTRYTGTTWFRGSATAYGRLAIALVGPSFHGIRPLIAMDRSVVMENGDEVAMCDPAPDGSCYRHFPRDAGTFAGVGLRATPINSVDIDVAAGHGAMGGSSWYVDGDAALRVSTHVRVLGLIRRVVIRQPSGFHLWWQPMAVGLRIQ